MSMRKDLRAELAGLQDRLETGPRYWRSLEELAGSEAFQELMRREFPEQASIWPDALSRRQFLALMGASLALAGLSGCSVRPAPSVNLVPYVNQPEEVVPGRPLFYATAMTLGGAGVGLLVESHMGRPTKIEGNPDHPASRGATSIFHQASVLTLYDPDRSQTVTHLGQTRTWDDAVLALRSALQKLGARGTGLRLLTETVVSPTLAGQLENLLRRYPDAKWHQYEPINDDAVHQAAQFAFGEPLACRYDFSKADVILSLDADFLTSGPASLCYVADFSARRRVRTSAADAAQAQMSRLYVIETNLTCTGAKADNRLAVPPQEIEQFTRALAARLGVGAIGDSGARYEKWVAAIAKDLQAHHGRGLVIAGQRQPAVVHLLAHALNEHLGNVGQTVQYTAPVAFRPVQQTDSLRELIQEMDQGRVELLVILSGNPVYTAPVDFRFGERLQKVPLRVHLSLYQDETSRLCHWHMPEAHYLEAWSDTRAYDGTFSIVQPLIEPLYHGRSAHELVAILTNKEQQATPGYEIVRAHWRKHWGKERPSTDFEQFWQSAVHDGVIANTGLPAKSVSLRKGWHEQLQPSKVAQAAPPPSDAAELAISFQPDPSIYDGRFANNGWLQELPKPLTKLTWENAVLMSPRTAAQFGLGFGSYAHGGEHGGYYMPVVELEVGGRKVRGPAWIQPGHADGCVTVALGYGRENAGRVGGNREQLVGFNAYALRTADQLWFASGLTVIKTGQTQLVACTQQHHLMENRETVRAATLAEYREKPRFAAEREKAATHPEAHGTGRQPLTLYRPFDYNPPRHKWGMSIDLTACVGCNACIVACQSENNIPVVGKEQVAAGREMHWIRVDRYISGPAEKPSAVSFQPVPCMHCENAPCEYVCPVEATVHSAEGLNDMVYNRCVGTRFCSNNCPYKVRRFNFFFYADYATPSTRLQFNPDVTVRSRGVMEKCTYCVQRIRHAEIDAQVEGRPIRDGEILTACQAACPAQAIIFGNINDTQSQVRRCKDTPLDYGLLADLNTEPRTTYLAALLNPNPELDGERGT
jgi:MoCo/4Fe-4S cofactor protein with predicted Tat translocation signal